MKLDMRRLTGCVQHITGFVPLVIAALAVFEVCAEDAALILRPESWPRVERAVAPDPALEAHAAELLARMSIKEKVGQLVQAEIQQVRPRDVKNYHLGSVLSGGGSWPGRRALASIEDWRELSNAFYEASVDTGNGRVGVPVLWGIDAVHGMNNLVGATLFPHNIGLGAANNEVLMQRIGEITAKETSAVGIDWTFAPTLAVARDDRWGRTYESYSEDPQIVAKLGAALVRGLQGAEPQTRFSAGRVLATAKHFIGDGGTVNGRDQGDTFVDERTLREVHGAGYYATLSEGVHTIMASFSSWRGFKLHGNKYLLTTVLKEHMGFDGFVVGDWNGHGQLSGCSNDSCPAAINAGIDMIMVPDDWKSFIGNTLVQVKDGRISESRIDDAVMRILRVKLRSGLFEKREKPLPKSEWIGHADHRQVARQAARESLVLLKAEDGVLPIIGNARVLVAGAGADDIAKATGGWTITWQGRDNPREHYLGATSILEGLQAAVQASGGSVIHEPRAKGDAEADVAILVFGESPYAEYEGDREHLVFAEHSPEPVEILERLQQRGIPVVSVFLSGRPMIVQRELELSKGFVAAWLPGSEGGAIADLLIGDASGAPRFEFEGKLSFSWPANAAQVRLNRDDDIYVPLFPVGYGLTYANLR